MIFGMTKMDLIPCAGLIADVDIESEKYRWMGSARLDFYVRKFFSLMTDCQKP